MCTMLAHTCVVVVHVFMFIGSKSAPLPSCGSIVLQNLMTCNCSISQKPVECFSDFQKSCSQLRGCTTSIMCVIGFILVWGECIGVPRYLEREVG